MTKGAPADAATYYIDEDVTYNGTHGCTAITNLNTITSSLASAMNAHFWTGWRYVDPQAYPQDFREACSSTAYGAGGEDSSYADNSALAVFAGHGGDQSLAFGYANSSVCSVDFNANMRLGTMSGAQGAFGMWLACEVLQSSDLSTNMHQWLRQQAGWQNSISINNDEPRDFFNRSNTVSNADAWLDQMGSAYYGTRDAIISSFDQHSADDCWETQSSASLYWFDWTSPLGAGPMCAAAQSLFYFCYEHTGA